MKSWVHLPISVSQTQFPSDIQPPHIPHLFHVNDWGQYLHINTIRCSPSPLAFLSEWLLSTGAYLHRDGKGTEERKSILYLTTKHNSNQKQLEFAGCSINWTASSDWRGVSGLLQCTTAQWPGQDSRHTQTHTHTWFQKLKISNSNGKKTHKAETGLTNRPSSVTNKKKHLWTI